MKLNVLPKKQRELWEKLAGVESIGRFYLAGGTAIALHLNHRESIDLDFFSSRSFQLEKLKSALGRCGPLSVVQEEAGTLHLQISGVKTSFLLYRYPQLAKTTVVEGINVAQLTDIVPMKLVAISQRGAKKDFIDLHAILQSGWSLEAMFEVLEKKFVGVRYNRMHILKSLTYFNDADSDPMPKMKAPADWGTIKGELSQIVHGYVERL